jgi:phosphoglycolate phosphatase
MQYRLAIFDFDGTLADSFPWFMRNVNDVADRFGFRRIEDHELPTLRGYDARQMMAHLRTPMWKMPLIARHMRARIAADAASIPLFPGVDAMLAGLAERGVRIAVVTSNSEQNVRRILGPQNASRVSHFACGASILGKRPKLRQVLRASGVPATHAIKIGDEIRDLHAAQAEHVAFGAVAWGYTLPESLRAHAPDLMFETMEEIVEKLTAGGVVRTASA